MIQIRFMSLILSAIATCVTAEEPSLPLVILCPGNSIVPEESSLPPHGSLEILESIPGEAEASLNERAMLMKHARYFVYDSRAESTQMAIYRERFANHGATIIDLREQISQSKSRPRWIPPRPQQDPIGMSYAWVESK